LKRQTKQYLFSVVGLVLIIFGLLLCSSVVYATMPLSIVSGLSDVLVVDLNGAPVVGAIVSVVAYYGAPLTNGLTDSNGVFSFDPYVVTDGPAVITASFNSYSIQGMWYPEAWSETTVLTLSFSLPTPTPASTSNPTPTFNPYPTPTWHPFETPTPTLHPTPTSTSILPILVPDDPASKVLMVAIGGLMIASGSMLVFYRKVF
jgi:hypothetical protein